MFWPDSAQKQIKLCGQASSHIGESKGHWLCKEHVALAPGSSQAHS